MAITVPGVMTPLTGSNPTTGDWTVTGLFNNGDLGIFWLFSQAGVFNITDPPTGLTTKINNAGGGFGRLYIGYRYLQTGDTTFTWDRSAGSANSSTIWGVTIVRGGPASGDPFETNSGVSTFTDVNDPDPPATTPTANDSLIWTFFGKRNDYTGTPVAPTDYTIGATGSDTVGNDASAGDAYRILTGGGGVSQDPGAWTLEGGLATDDGSTWTGSIAPAVGGVSVTPGIATLTLTAFVPTVLTPRLVTPGIAVLTITPFAPVVLTPVTVTPGTASLVLTRFTPIVTTPVLVIPGTAALVLTRFAPSVATGLRITPGTASLVLTRFAPTVSASAHITVIPGTATLLLAAFSPTVLTPRLVTPGVATLVLAPFAPTIVATAHITVIPGTANLILTVFAPTVTALATIGAAIATELGHFLATGSVVVVSTVDGDDLEIAATGSEQSYHTAKASESL